MGMTSTVSRDDLGDTKLTMTGISSTKVELAGRLLNHQSVIRQLLDVR